MPKLASQIAYHVVADEVTREDVDELRQVEVLGHIRIAVLDTQAGTEISNQSFHDALPLGQIFEQRRFDLYVVCSVCDYPCQG
jgi:hypothetical protein